MLGALALTGNHQSSGDMPNADGGLDFVDVLAALAAGTEGVNFEFIRRNVGLLAFFDFCNNIHRSKAGVAPFIRIERRDADQPMYASFSFAKAVGIFTTDDHVG